MLKVWSQSYKASLLQKNQNQNIPWSPVLASKSNKVLRGQGEHKKESRYPSAQWGTSSGKDYLVSLRLPWRICSLTRHSIWIYHWRNKLILITKSHMKRYSECRIPLWLQTTTITCCVRSCPLKSPSKTTSTLSTSSDLRKLREWMKTTMKKCKKFFIGSTDRLRMPNCQASWMSCLVSNFLWSTSDMSRKPTTAWGSISSISSGLPTLLASLSTFC